MREESKKQVFTREIIFGWNSILQAVVLREGTELKTRRRVKLQTICKVHFRASKIAPCLQYCTYERMLELKFLLAYVLSDFEGLEKIMH